MKGQYIRSSYNNRKYFTLGGCLVLKRQYTYNKATITENISLWEGVVVMKGQYIRSSYNNRKYFTLGGCLVLKRQYTYNKATITENISLWEGVWS